MSDPGPRDEGWVAGLAPEAATDEAWPDDEDMPGGTAAGGAPGPDGTVADELTRLTAWVQGRVQGVGFRWWVRANALELGLVGVAENLTDGRVKVVAEGARENCAALLKRLEGSDAPGRVVQVTFRWDQVRGGLAGFAER